MREWQIVGEQWNRRGLFGRYENKMQTSTSLKGYCSCYSSAQVAKPPAWRRSRSTVVGSPVMFCCVQGQQQNVKKKKLYLEYFHHFTLPSANPFWLLGNSGRYIAFSEGRPCLTFSRTHRSFVDLPLPPSVNMFWYCDQLTIKNTKVKPNTRKK